MDLAFRQYNERFDHQFGGFGSAPKFPTPHNLLFLLRYYNRTQNSEALEIVTKTLTEMRKGGMYDQIGFGFHRYSTDRHWLVPHFEKMLYDNAQLITAYVAAYQMTSDDYFAKIAGETAAYVLHDMTSPRGGFYSAEDADSIPGKPDQGNPDEEQEKIEGAFYVWSRKELYDILEDDAADIFSFHFDVFPEGNAEHDPHGYFEGKNILHVKQTVEETAIKFNLSKEKTGRIINEAKEKLYYARMKRKRPHLDDKILTSWNGLMISALCKAFQVLGDKKYLEAAKNAAEFILSDLYDEKTGRLFRRWRDGEKNILGMGSDYAFFISGLIDLYVSDSGSKWLETAVFLSEEHLRLFYDAEYGGFYMTSPEHDKNLILRVKDDSDSVIPSPGSVAIRNLFRLSGITGRMDFAKTAEKSIEMILSGDAFHPASFPDMLAALCNIEAGEDGKEQETDI